MQENKCKSCPYCEAYEAAFIAPDYVSGESFSIMECSECGNGMTDISTGISPEDAYYSDYYYGENNQKFNPLLESIIRWFRKQRANTLISHFKQSGNILDIGCGRAHMLYAFKNSGWNCIGTELSNASSQFARNNYDIDVQLTKDIDTLSLPKESQDLVTMFHVFEHVENPANTLNQIHTVLKPNGILVIEVPNFDSWQSRWWNDKWHHLDPPRHLFHFSKKGLIKTLDQNGFSVVNLSTWSLEFGPFGMVQSMLNAISFEYNFLFKLLKGKWRNKDRNLLHFTIDTIIHVLLFLPALYFSLMAEIISVVSHKGGVINLVAQKKDSRL